MTGADALSRANRDSPVGLLVLGLASGVLGLLPWLIQGAELPLQNLWADQSVVDSMPLVLLPFSQYYLEFLAGVMVLPWLFIGFVARGPLLAGAAHRLVTLALGVTLVQMCALAQTSIVVAMGLGFSGRRGTFALLYMLGMVGGCLLSMGVGILVFLLLSRAPRSEAVLGLGMASVVLAPWAREFLFAGQFTAQYWQFGSVLGGWVAAAFLGIIVGWNGVWPTRRLLTSAAALAIWWIGRAVLIGLSFMVGSRASLGRLADMARFFINAFTRALQEVHVSAIVVAVVAAVVTLTVRCIRSCATGGSADASVSGANPTSRIVQP